MPEYYTRELKLSIKVFCRITLASALLRGAALHIMHHAYVVSKRRNFLSTDRVKNSIFTCFRIKTSKTIMLGAC